MSTPPVSQDIFFGQRGGVTFDDAITFDLSINYQLPIFKDFDLWIKADIFNIFDDDTQIAGDSNVTANRSRSDRRSGHPHHLHRAWELPHGAQQRRLRDSPGVPLHRRLPLLGSRSSSVFRGRLRPPPFFLYSPPRATRSTAGSASSRLTLAKGRWSSKPHGATARDRQVCDSSTAASGPARDPRVPRAPLLAPLALIAAGFLTGCSDPPESGPADASNGAANIATQPLFLDATAAAGLDFIHFNGMSGEYYFPEMTGGGVALLDYDRDGDLDVYLVQGQMLGDGRSPEQATLPPDRPAPLGDRLYRNDLIRSADGDLAVRLVDVTAAERPPRPPATAWAWRSATSTTTAGRTSTSPTSAPTSCCATAATAPSRTSRRAAAPTTRAGASPRRSSTTTATAGSTSSSATTSSSPSPPTSGAARQPGRPTTAGRTPTRPVADRLLRNRGDGTFEDVTGRSGLERAQGAALGVVAADFDGDGWPDLYVANDGMANQLWINRGDGTFEDRALLGGSAFNMVGDAEASMGVDAGDFDNDGDEDLFITHLTQETNTLYLNNGGGDFRDETVAAGLGSATFDATGFATGWLDFDNDGWLDLVMLNGAVKVIEALRRAGDPHPLHQPNQLFRNLGDGRFDEVDRARRAGLRAVRGQPRGGVRRHRQRRRHRPGGGQQRRAGAAAAQRHGPGERPGSACG